MRYRVVPAILLAATLGMIVQARAQTTPPAKPAPPQAPAMTVRQIGGPLYFVKGGSGANTAFYVGSEAVIAIDAKMTADAARQMLAEIAKVTPLPVKFLIISHSDGDHVNGLAGFPGDLTIISSVGTKKEMEEAFQGEKFADLRAYLPNKTFESESELMFKVPGGKMVDINLRHDGPAHTSGDTVIVFPEEKAAFIGDLAFVGRDPLIHRQKGGTVFGYLDTLRKMIALENVETYLSGHADPLTKADLKTLLAALEEKVGKVKAMIAEGKTLDEIKAAFGVAAAAAGQPSRFPSFVEIVYLELTEKK